MRVILWAAHTRPQKAATRQTDCFVGAVSCRADADVRGVPHWELAFCIYTVLVGWYLVLAYRLIAERNNHTDEASFAMIDQSAVGVVDEHVHSAIAGHKHLFQLYTTKHDHPIRLHSSAP